MKKEVNYKVNGEEWEEAKTDAFNKLSKKVKVDGFRNGKVPRSVFEKKYGTGDIVREAMEELLDKKYAETIVSEKLIPVVEPKLEIVSMNDDGFEAKVTFILDIFNLLPLPALDGGRIVCLLITTMVEAVTRKKIDPKYEGYLHGAGMILLLALMAVIMFKDIFVLIKG